MSVSFVFWEMAAKRRWQKQRYLNFAPLRSPDAEIEQGQSQAARRGSRVAR
jgi:hypothetical protein